MTEPLQWVVFLGDTACYALVWSFVVKASSRNTMTICFHLSSLVAFVIILCLLAVNSLLDSLTWRLSFYTFLLLSAFIMLTSRLLDRETVEVLAIVEYNA